MRSSTSKYRLLLCFLSSTALSLTQTTPPPVARTFPIQAELVASLNAAKLQIGDRVLTKLTREWTYGACILPRGSALVGHVTALNLRSKTSKPTSIALLFDTSCGGETPQPLIWIALLAPDDSDLAGLHSGDPVAVQAFRSSSFGESGGIGSSGISTHVDLSGRQNPNFPVSLDPAPDRSHPRPTSIFTGQVWGVPDLTLKVAIDYLGSSLLTSRKKELRLAAGTVLVLSPPHAPSSPTAQASTSPHTSTSRSASQDPALAANDLCQLPTCSVVSPRPGATPTATLLQTVSLTGLGYHRLRSAEMLDLEFGAALSYLGPDHLLFTFNPHTLIPRSPDDDRASHPHMVRAVLFNLRTSTPETTFDWRVADDRQYLWPLAEDRVLVHTGDRLRILGLIPKTSSPEAPSPEVANLQELASVPLSSRLVFVRSSPDRRHIAVGILHELHTPEVHARLAEANANGPEEEVSVLLFDEALHPIGNTRQSSWAMPPILSDDGRITLFHAGGEHWRYQETSWTGVTRTFARVNSACIPVMTALSSNLFYISGCDVRAIGRWYRVLRSNGSIVLKGTLLSQDMEPLPLANQSGESFALALLSGRDGYLRNSPFHSADLSSEVIRVFSSTDGRSLCVTDMHAPTPTKQPIAFAPGGSRIAILDGEQIAIYGLHENTAQPTLAKTAAAPLH